MIVFDHVSQSCWKFLKKISLIVIGRYYIGHIILNYTRITTYWISTELFKFFGEILYSSTPLPKPKKKYFRT